MQKVSVTKKTKQITYNLIILDEIAWDLVVEYM